MGIINGNDVQLMIDGKVVARGEATSATREYKAEKFNTETSLDFKHSFSGSLTLKEGYVSIDSPLVGYMFKSIRVDQVKYPKFAHAVLLRKFGR